jgi:diphosphomevalonate decarboxylase
MSTTIKSSTSIAPTNLALIKYWGKRDVVLNLPINSSISVTLDYHDLQTITTASLVQVHDGKDRIWLNGEEIDINSRTAIVFKEMRELCRDENLKRYTIYIVSRNSFPTAAGLASSAAGYAAMVTALAGVFNIDVKLHGTELSRVARRGSGSACRSLFGGIVAWNMGMAQDGSDSYAQQVVPVSHWNELEAIICVASDHKKHVSSTSGMQTSVQTSLLLNHRAAVIVPNRFHQMIEFIRTRQDNKVFETTMKDSNQFHACCLDTFPPIFYMTDVSRHVVSVVEELNFGNNGARFAYTFDAGPNAVIFCNKAHSQELLTKLLQVFHPSLNDIRKDKDFMFVRGRTNLSRGQVMDSRAGMTSLSDYSGELMYIFHTGIGEGSYVLGEEESKLKMLADERSGLPLKMVM